jgi:catechol 2,3-dioxygenase-like lactoylglutathione lyase family enzyme
MDFPVIDGYGHLNFTVTDVGSSARWWEKVMGFTLVHAEQRESGVKAWNVYHPSLGSVGLIEHPHPGTDRFRGALLQPPAVGG